jgi:hypothetical protein
LPTACGHTTRRSRGARAVAVPAPGGTAIMARPELPPRPHRLRGGRRNSASTIRPSPRVAAESVSSGAPIFTGSSRVGTAARLPLAFTSRRHRERRWMKRDHRGNIRRRGLLRTGLGGLLVSAIRPRRLLAAEAGTDPALAFPPGFV